MTIVADYVTNKSLPFQRERAQLGDQGGGFQEGVVNQTDLAVSQRGAGANMSVDVAVGAAWVQIDTGTRNGVSHLYSDAIVNTAITAAHATLPRLDQVVLRYNDSFIPTGAGDVPTIEVVAGTPTTGATLDNRTGATALPNDCLRLADVLVPAASSTVVSANIRDRRLFCRGANYGQRGAAVGNTTTASTGFVTLDAGLYDGRFELGPNSIFEVVFSGLNDNTGGGAVTVYRLLFNGTAARDLEIGVTAPFSLFWRSGVSVSGSPSPGTVQWQFQWRTTIGANVGTLRNNATFTRPILSLREYTAPVLVNNFN